MALINLPAWPVANMIDWQPHQPSQMNRSEFTRKTRTTILGGGSYWAAKVGYPTVYGEAVFRPWRSALMRLRGRVNTFRLSACEGPQHRELQAVVVDGAGQQGFALATRGWQPAGGLRDGMFVTVTDGAGKGWLLQVAADTLLAGSDGMLTLTVEPNIPEGLLDGAAIETRDPYATMRMTTDAPGWKVSAGQEYSVSFDCEEA